MRAPLVLILAALISGTAAAGTKIIKNDTFTGAGGIFAGWSFGEFQGAGVLFEPAPGEYPLKIIGIDVLVVPYQLQGVGVGAYELDVWDEVGGTVAPPRPSDGGPDYLGKVDRASLQFTSSVSLFNRFTLPTPLIVNAGKIFVKVSEQTETAIDFTTIALDNAATPKAGANWYFDGFGSFHPFELADGGYYNGLNRNWVIRLVLEVPDQAVSITDITPSSGLTSTATPVIITGTNFELGARAFLGTDELAITALTGATIGATVPAGLAPGRYAVRVQNPAGGQASLPDGYTVLGVDGGSGTGGGGGSTGGGAGGGNGGSGTETLSLTGVTPTKIWADDTSSLFLTGAGFRDGALVLVGSTKVEGAVIESSGVISAALPAGLFAQGVYDVSVINLSGERATLPMSFTVLAGNRSAPTGCGCTAVDLWPLTALALVVARRRRR